MTEKEAIDKFDPRHSNDSIYCFIKRLYNDGGFIASPEDKKKLDGMTVLAQIHGMNPFEKKKK